MPKTGSAPAFTVKFPCPECGVSLNVIINLNLEFDPTAHQPYLTITPNVDVYRDHMNKTHPGSIADPTNPTP